MVDTEPKTAAGRVDTRGGFGTFAGVFTPSILTILGIIIFLRLGYVVGSSGLFKGLAIILLANVISVLTTFSLSAIATNFQVKGGGIYYLISRTLGLRYGGSIGIVLFLAQSVSIGFYCVGFAEVLAAMVRADSQLLVQIIAAIAVLSLFIIAWRGADFATRFQYFVMVLLAASILSFVAGALGQWDGGVLAQNVRQPAQSPPFWVVFAIFFPAVTGFTQGVAMSGDLRDPGKSIPVGTFLAVGLSIAIYIGVAILFAASAPNEILANDYAAMRNIAAAGWLIDAGVIAATLSSALASFLGAPRILQSLASDRIFPFLRSWRRAKPESTAWRGAFMRHRTCRGCTRQSRCDCPGGVDVLSGVVRVSELCDLFRSERRESVVPADVSLVQQVLQPCRVVCMRWCSAGDRHLVRGHCDRDLAGNSSVFEGQG